MPASHVRDQGAGAARLALHEAYRPPPGSTAAESLSIDVRQASAHRPFDVRYGKRLPRVCIHNEFETCPVRVARQPGYHLLTFVRLRVTTESGLDSTLGARSSYEAPADQPPLFLASRLPAAEDASTLAPGPRLDHNRRVNPARKARADPKPRWIWGVTLGVLGAIAGDLVLLAINLTSPRAGLSGLQGDVRIASPLFAATFIMLGALVASRLPKNPVGWILWAGGLGTTVQLLMTEYAWTALRTGPLPGAAAVGSLANGLGPAGFLSSSLFL